MIALRLHALMAQIHAQCLRVDRDPTSVSVLTVTKGQPSVMLREAFAAGLHQMGESYVQEALTKQAELTDLPITWHFIGPLQSNKAKHIANHFDWVHSLSSRKMAQKLNDYRLPHRAPLNICIQVNLDHEPTKSGIFAEELPDLIHAITQLPHLKLRGLMCLPKPESDFHRQVQSFLRLTTLFNLEKNRTPMDTLSMGTSQDFNAAICAGSTLLRLGQALFSDHHWP